MAHSRENIRSTVCYISLLPVIANADVDSQNQETKENERNGENRAGTWNGQNNTLYLKPSDTSTIITLHCLQKNTLHNV